MNTVRVQQDIAAAQRKFDYVEAHRTIAGQPYALVALQTASRTYTLQITFPGYPNQAPEVVVRKPTLAPSKHRYPDNRICYILRSHNPQSLLSNQQTLQRQTVLIAVQTDYCP